MEQRQTQPHPGERVRAPTTKPGWEGKRPLFWRLPLLAFLVSGVVCLNYLDGRLSSDYRKSAADLAIQADAMIEGAVQKVPAAILDQLAEGGRLGTVIAAPTGMLGVAHLMVKEGGVASGRPLFDAGTPPLPGFAAPPRFTF